MSEIKQRLRKEIYEQKRKWYTCGDCILYEKCYGAIPHVDCTFVDHPICQDFKN